MAGYDEGDRSVARYSERMPCCTEVRVLVREHDQNVNHIHGVKNSTGDPGAPVPTDEPCEKDARGLHAFRVVLAGRSSVWPPLMRKAAAMRDQRDVRFQLQSIQSFCTRIRVMHCFPVGTPMRTVMRGKLASRSILIHSLAAAQLTNWTTNRGSTVKSRYDSEAA